MVKNVKTYLPPVNSSLQEGTKVSSKGVEGLEYLEGAAKWFKVRAVSIVLVFVGVAVATVASLQMIRGLGGPTQPTEIAKVMATSAINALPRVLITSVFDAAWVALLALPLANLARYFRVSSGAVVAGVVAPAIAHPLALALMYNWLMSRVYVAVKDFIRAHMSEFATAFMSRNVNLIIKLTAELNQAVSQALLPAYLVSLITLVPLVIATYLVAKLSNVVKASSIKALWIFYVISIVITLLTQLVARVSTNFGLLMVISALGTLAFVIYIVIAVLEWLTGSRIKDYVASVRESIKEAELIESGGSG